MGERKVLNKYYPPDFDPSKLPRPGKQSKNKQMTGKQSKNKQMTGKQSKNKQMKVRNMLSMSIRCKTCGNYMSKGTKFNARKEIATGETYLGIEIVRFYFRCSGCSAEFTTKTDPQKSGYVVESGVTRNCDSPWEEDEATENQKRKRDVEEMGNAMRSLENRMQDTRREMNIDTAIDELISMRSIRANVSTDVVLEALQRKAAEEKKQQAEEDKAIIASIFSKRRDIVVRIADEVVEDEDEDEDGDADSYQLPNRCGGETWTCNSKRRRVLKDLQNLIEVSDSDSNKNANSNKPKSIFKSSSGTVSVMIKNKSPTTSTGKDQVTREESNQEGKSKVEDKTTRSTGLQSIQNYESDDESS